MYAWLSRSNWKWSCLWRCWWDCRRVSPQAIHRVRSGCERWDGYNVSSREGRGRPDCDQKSLFGVWVDVCVHTFHGLSLSKKGLTSAVTRSTASGVENAFIMQQPSSIIAWTICSGSDLWILWRVCVFVVAKGVEKWLRVTSVKSSYGSKVYVKFKVERWHGWLWLLRWPEFMVRLISQYEIVSSLIPYRR